MSSPKGQIEATFGSPWIEWVVGAGVQLLVFGLPPFDSEFFLGPRVNHDWSSRNPLWEYEDKPRTQIQYSLLSVCAAFLS